MTPMRRDETADAVRDTTRDVGSWLDRLEFPGVEPSGDSDPARSMREDLRVNFYDTVQHWLGDLRHRLRAIERECQVEAPAVEEHVAETMARIIDAARDVAASATPPADAREPEPGAELEPEPEQRDDSDEPDESDESGEVVETVASFRAKLHAERQRLAERAREQRIAALDRLRRGPAANDAAATAPDPPEQEEADEPGEAEERVEPERDGIRFRRVDQPSRA